MGALATLDPDDNPPTADVIGEGKRLVTWWDTIADDEDRATLRSWVDAGAGARVISERLTRSGYPIGLGTVSEGLRLLRRHRWAT